MKSEIVDKLDVVSSQITEAVWLFFEERDHVVIHTVIASAHQILLDLGSRIGVESTIKNTSHLSKKETQEFLKSINYPYNFFKHADKDPDNKIDIGPLHRFTQDFIMDAIVMLQNINTQLPMAAKVFWNWFVSYYPEEFENLPKDGQIAAMQEQKLGQWPFEEIVQFLKFSEVVDNGRT